MEIYAIIKENVKISLTFVHDTTRNWEKNQEIKESQREKFPMEDVTFRNDLRNFNLENARPRGGRNLTLQDIDDYVTERLEIVK